MDANPAPFLYPLEHSKILHLVRHAQGTHNVAGEKDHNALLSPEYFDAHLSPLGWQQVGNLRKQVHASGQLRRIDLVITSPLCRAMQTATQVFCGISSLKCPPIVAAELCRERLGVHPCDKRRTISENRSRFPTIDFSLIESDEDILWKTDARETDEEIAARGLEFMSWLWTRPEKEIAIVTHHRFLQHTLNALANDCHPSVKNKMCKKFGNCELRSMVIVDKEKGKHGV
ncbi:PHOSPHOGLYCERATE MUTASE FAMILY PROTEIN [Salix koriyanagi]|uniref:PHOSPHOGLYCERATE MUTASE FAMILY PROTEIN n=1 Tax=Salix koriyanagi TaxID=2511006 RepID=A0A9Q0YSK6_9ROSI|nr:PHOSPHOGLYCERATE MUTASE FAMILY PROTEIN [Salix koriyanagi]